MRALGERLPPRAVVFTDQLTGYELAAVPARLRQLDAADSQQRHAREPPGAPCPRRAALLPQRRPALGARAVTAPAGCSSTARASATCVSACRRRTRMGDTFCIDCDESPARDDVLPAGGRGRRAAAAEDGHAPARARDRDARARARRPEVASPRRRAAPADAGLRPPRPLPRPARAAALRGDARPRGRPTCCWRRRSSPTGACCFPTQASPGCRRRCRPPSGSSRARESTP